METSRRVVCFGCVETRVNKEAEKEEDERGRMVCRVEHVKRRWPCRRADEAAQEVEEKEKKKEAEEQEKDATKHCFVYAAETRVYELRIKVDQDFYGSRRFGLAGSRWSEKN